MNRSRRILAALAIAQLAAAAAWAQSDVETAEQALRDRDYRMAVVYYQRALRDDPADARLLAGLAQSYELWGKWEQARATAEDALDRDPASLAALLLVARAHVRATEWEAARARYEQVLTIDPASVEARAGLVQSLRSSGDLAGAEAARRRFEE